MKIVKMPSAKKLTGPLRHFLHHARRPPAGSAPGVIAVDETSPSPSLSAIRYTADSHQSWSNISVDELAGLLKEDGNLWVNVNGLGDAEVIQRIGTLFALHPLVVADVVHLGQRAKVEPYEDYLFLVLRMLSGEESIAHEQVSMVVGKRFVLTFQEREGDCFGLVRERLERGNGRIRAMGTDYLAYALVDAVVDGYFPPLEAIGSRLDDLESDLLEKPMGSVLKPLHVLKRELLVMRRAVWPLREMVNQCLRLEHEGLLGSHVRIYLRDCYDHTIQIMEMIETFRELASSQMELYVSTVGQRTNEIVKVLTMFASIFIPLTFIVGIYGMNFEPEASPWNMPELSWYWGYPAVMGFMLAVTLAIVFYFWRRGWFHGN
jgi:magnesium transporter